MLARVAGAWIVSFSIADEHAHLIVLGDRDRIGRLRRNLSLALGAASSEPLDPSWARPLASRAHLQSTFEYQLTQVDHHGLPAHPALWSGSVFQDLIGARLLDGLQLKLPEALPRYRVRDALSAVGLPRLTMAGAEPRFEPDPRPRFDLREALGGADGGDGDAGDGDSGRVFSTHVGTVVGTPAYRSPEQASGEAVDARSGVFSVCVLAYELLTLRHPWAGRRNVQEVLAAVVRNKPRAARCGWWCGPWPAEPDRR